MRYFNYTILCILLVLSLNSHSNAGPKDPIIVQGDSVVTQENFDAEIFKIPAKDRLPFLVDGERAKKTLQVLLRYQRIADDARKSGFDKNPTVQQRIRLAETRELADAYLDHIEENKLTEANFELMAKEYYLLHKQEFVNTGSRDIAHILISTNGRGKEAAQIVINDLYAKLISEPELWGEFVTEFSEDPGSKGNGGKYLAVTRGKMVKPFEDAAFSLNQSGEISKPIVTQFGYHIIRLDKVYETDFIPFEAVKNKLVSEQQITFSRNARNEYISHINTSDPVVIPDCALDEMVARYFKTDEYNVALAACLRDKSEKNAGEVNK